MTPNAIQVLLINLDRRPDRLASVKQSLDQLGISFERISAVDGRVASEKDLECSQISGPLGPLADTIRACTASHVKCWRHLLAGQHRFALILEDDVILSPEFAAIASSDGWIPDDVDLIKLEKFAPNRPSKILAGKVLGRTAPGGSEIRRMYSRHTGSAAYVISRKGAEIALSDLGRNTVAVDHLLFNETVSQLCVQLKPAIVIPPVAWQDFGIGGTSDVADIGGQKVEGIPPRSLAKRIQSMKRAYFEARLMPKQLFMLLIGRAQLVTLRTPHSSGVVLPGLLRKFLK